MQNKLFIYGLVGVVLVGGIVAFAMKKSDTSQNGENSDPTQTAPIGMTEGATLKDLIATNGSNKCTFSETVANSQNSGTIYINDEKMRGDFVTVASGQTINSHMIVINETSYVWSDMATQGIKMSFAKLAAQASSSASTNTQSKTVDINQRLNYDCSNWSADASVFSLPSNITFTDLSSLVPSASGSAGASTGASTNSYQCSACNSITDANGKAQCKALYKCQ
jgi:hypothetical protein